jgi:hypothetical protein
MMGLHQYKQGGGGFAQALCQPGGWLVSLEVGGGLQRRGRVQAWEEGRRFHLGTDPAFASP